MVNCHLAAGPSPDKRLSSLQDSLKSAERLLKEQGAHVGTITQANKNVLVCGDFNADADVHGVNAAEMFLTTGQVDPDVVEDGIQVTKKTKRHGLSPFVDCGRDCGPTLSCVNVDGRMLRQRDATSGRVETTPPTSGGAAELSLTETNEQVLTAEMLAALRECFDNLRRENEEGPFHEERARSDEELSAAGVDAWLTRVNRVLGRGTEFRAARAIQEGKRVALSTTGAPTRSCSTAGNAAPCEDQQLLPGLSFDEFASVYRAECEQGKFWAVEHDLQAMRRKGLHNSSGAPWRARFDRVFLSSEGGVQKARAGVLGCFPKEMVGDGGEDELSWLRPRRGAGQGASASVLGGSTPVDADVLLSGTGCTRGAAPVRPRAVSTLRSLANVSSPNFVLPNEWHPSDHLPLVVDLQIR